MIEKNDSPSGDDNEVSYAIPADLVSRAKGVDALVLLSVWSNPYISMIGVTSDAVGNIAKYTRLQPDEVDAALKRLDKAKEVVFDPNTQEVMAPEWIKYNLPTEDGSQDVVDDQPDISGMPFSQTLRDYFQEKNPGHLFRAGFWLKKQSDAALNKMIEAIRDTETAKSDLLLLGLGLITAESGKDRFKEDEMQGALIALAQILILERLKRDEYIQIDGHIQIAKPVKAQFTKKGLLAKANAQSGDIIAMVDLQLAH